MVILRRKRLALYRCIFVPTDFAAIYPGIRCGLPRLVEIVKQVMIRASEVPVEFEVRHLRHTLFRSRILCNTSKRVLSVTVVTSDLRSAPTPQTREISRFHLQSPRMSVARLNVLSRLRVSHARQPTVLKRNGSGRTRNVTMPWHSARGRSRSQPAWLTKKGSMQRAFSRFSPHCQHPLNWIEIEGTMPFSRLSVRLSRER
jgi:hypothetical protein